LNKVNEPLIQMIRLFLPINFNFYNIITYNYKNNSILMNIYIYIYSNLIVTIINKLKWLFYKKNNNNKIKYNKIK